MNAYEEYEKNFLEELRKITDFKDWWRQANTFHTIDLNYFHRKLIREDIRSVLGDLRFDMSGYNSRKTGDCVEENINVLHKFLKCGIYNYTEYLHVDFYKGIPRIHYQYWCEREHHLEELVGLTTSQIILRVLEITVYSGKRTRRNWN